MEEIVLDLILKQGSDFFRRLIFQNPDETPMDITGYIFRGQARTDYDSTDIAFSFQFTISNALAGEVDMKVSNIATTALDLSENTKFVYDCEMVSPTSNVEMFLRGKIQMIREVTR
jgi:hypothetical protein